MSKVAGGADSRTATCTMHEESATCFVVTFSIAGSEVGVCRCASRAAALDQAGFLLDRLVEEGWVPTRGPAETIH
jgi:hypothetical protein